MSTQTEQGGSRRRYKEENIVSSIMWVNIALAVPFIAVFIGIPLWMTFRHPETSADHAQAHAYLAAKAKHGAQAPAVQLAAIGVAAVRTPERARTRGVDAQSSRARAA